MSPRRSFCSCGDDPPGSEPCRPELNSAGCNAAHSTRYWPFLENGERVQEYGLLTPCPWELEGVDMAVEIQPCGSGKGCDKYVDITFVLDSFKVQNAAPCRCADIGWEHFEGSGFYSGAILQTALFCYLSRSQYDDPPGALGCQSIPEWTCDCRVTQGPPIDGGGGGIDVIDPVPDIWYPETVHHVRLTKLSCDCYWGGFWQGLADREPMCFPNCCYDMDGDRKFCVDEGYEDWLPLTDFADDDLRKMVPICGSMPARILDPPLDCPGLGHIELEQCGMLHSNCLDCGEDFARVPTRRIFTDPVTDSMPVWYSDSTTVCINSGKWKTVYGNTGDDGLWGLGGWVWTYGTGWGGGWPPVWVRQEDGGGWLLNGTDWERSGEDEGGWVWDKNVKEPPELSANGGWEWDPDLPYTLEAHDYECISDAKVNDFINGGWACSIDNWPDNTSETFQSSGVGPALCLGEKCSRNCPPHIPGCNSYIIPNLDLGLKLDAISSWEWDARWHHCLNYPNPYDCQHGNGLYHLEVRHRPCCNTPYADNPTSPFSSETASFQIKACMDVGNFLGFGIQAKLSIAPSPRRPGFRDKFGFARTWLLQIRGVTERQLRATGLQMDSDNEYLIPTDCEEGQIHRPIVGANYLGQWYYGCSPASGFSYSVFWSQFSWGPIGAMPELYFGSSMVQRNPFDSCHEENCGDCSSDTHSYGGDTGHPADIEYRQPWHLDQCLSRIWSQTLSWGYPVEHSCVGCTDDDCAQCFDEHEDEIYCWDHYDDWDYWEGIDWANHCGSDSDFENTCPCSGCRDNAWIPELGILGREKGVEHCGEGCTADCDGKCWPTKLIEDLLGYNPECDYAPCYRTWTWPATGDGGCWPCPGMGGSGDPGPGGPCGSWLGDYTVFSPNTCIAGNLDIRGGSCAYHFEVEAGDPLEGSCDGADSTYSCGGCPAGGGPCACGVLVTAGDEGDPVSPSPNLSCGYFNCADRGCPDDCGDPEPAAHLGACCISKGGVIGQAMKWWEIREKCLHLSEQACHIISQGLYPDGMSRKTTWAGLGTVCHSEADGFPCGVSFFSEDVNECVCPPNIEFRSSVRANRVKTLNPSFYFDVDCVYDVQGGKICQTNATPAISPDDSCPVERLFYNPSTVFDNEADWWSWYNTYDGVNACGIPDPNTLRLPYDSMPRLADPNDLGTWERIRIASMGGPGSTLAYLDLNGNRQFLTSGVSGQTMIFYNTCDDHIPPDPCCPGGSHLVPGNTYGHTWTTALDCLYSFDWSFIDVLNPEGFNPSIGGTIDSNIRPYCMKNCVRCSINIVTTNASAPSWPPAAPLDP